MEHLKVAGPTLDQILESLASEQRRLALRYLMESSNQASVDDLVDHIREQSAIDYRGNRAKIQIHLHHTHLPKLEASGLIDYDQRSGAVRYHPDDRIESLLEYFSGGYVRRRTD